MLEWHPIETVPRDETPVLVYLPIKHLRSHYAVATYFPKNTAIVGGNFLFDLESKPTHWAAIENGPTPATLDEDSAQS